MSKETFFFGVSGSLVLLRQEARPSEESEKKIRNFNEKQMLKQMYLKDNYSCLLGAIILLCNSL